MYRRDRDDNTYTYLVVPFQKNSKCAMRGPAIGTPTEQLWGSTFRRSKFSGGMECCRCRRISSSDRVHKQDHDSETRWRATVLKCNLFCNLFPSHPSHPTQPYATFKNDLTHWSINRFPLLWRGFVEGEIELITVSKTVDLKGSVGSNPTLSANSLGFVSDVGKRQHLRLLTFMA